MNVRHSPKEQATIDAAWSLTRAFAREVSKDHEDALAYAQARATGHAMMTKYRARAHVLGAFLFGYTRGHELPAWRLFGSLPWQMPANVCGANLEATGQHPPPVTLQAIRNAIEANAEAEARAERVRLTTQPR